MTLLLDRHIEGRKTHAFVVGVGAYPEAKANRGVTEALSNVPDLPSAADSAKLFTDWLLENQDRLGAPLGTLEVLISDPQSPANRYPWNRGPIDGATNANVKQSGAEWFQRLVKGDGDVALFYCCGHGASHLQQPVLFLEDLNEDPANTWCHLNLGYVASALRKLPNVSAAFLFSDACGQYVPDFELVVPPPQDCRFFPASPFGTSRNQVSLLCAAAEGQFAYEGTQSDASSINFGRFTQTLLKGLSGSSARLTRTQYSVCSADLLKDLKSIRRVFFKHWDPTLPFEPYQAFTQTDPPPIVYPVQFKLPVVISTDPEERNPYYGLLLSRRNEPTAPCLQDRARGFDSKWETSVSPSIDPLYAIAVDDTAHYVLPFQPKEPAYELWVPVP
ncbi:hypothetical protein ACVDG9_18425 [Roseibium sp. RP-7]